MRPWMRRGVPTLLCILAAGAPVCFLHARSRSDALTETCSAQADADERWAKIQGRDPVDDLWAVALNGSARQTEKLLDGGADVNARWRNDWTALHCAAFAGRVDMTACQLECGADPLAQTALGATPLHVAAGSHRSGGTGASRAEVARLLLASGADPHAATVGHSTALDRARLNGSTEVIELLTKTTDGR